MEKELLFETKHMHKAFGPTIALKDVDFSLYRGEIRGLVGENGSGKSTIMSIASGMQPATSGEMLYHGEPWNPSSMVEAQEKGISMILQEANTIPNVTVAQNIFSGHEKDFTNKLGFVNNKAMVMEAQALLDKFGISHIHAADSINYYGFEDRKLIEIVRCVKDDTEILVVDESTTALSLDGRQVLFKVIKKMAAENKAIVFISHDMDEIIDECSVLTVLRDGDIVGEVSAEDMLAAKNDPVTRQEVLKRARHMMVGRELGEKYYREDFVPSHGEKVTLEFENVSFGNIKNFSMKLHEGEIIGFGGLSGCGMHEIGRAAFGLEKIKKGKVIRNGVEITTPLKAIQNGVGYISKNRDLEALILDGPIGENIILPSIDALGKGGGISPKKAKKLAADQIEQFSIKCHSAASNVNTLSGGNKQKVSFAKWTAKDSDVIIMDCPTRGVDVGVKQSMYALMEQMKKDGKTILMISEELAELIGMADRLVIMKDFVVSKEFERSADLEQTDVIEYII